MGKKILITGASGFIGKVLMENLINTNYELIPMVRKSIGFRNEIVIDFNDSSFYTKVNSLPKVEVVVHLGAKIGFGNVTSKELFVPNVFSTAVLVNWANMSNAYFLFASTAIISGIRSNYITSESKPCPDTDYAYSKWLAEEIIKMSGVKSAILRIGGVFGKNGPSHLGINTAIDRALKGQSPIQYGDGKIKRNYIYVKDLAEVIKFCIEKEVEGIHLVAGSFTYSIAEMLQIICDVLLPEKNPEICSGSKDSYDQIIEHSLSLPKGRSFKEAIEDIKSTLNNEKTFL